MCCLLSRVTRASFIEVLGQDYIRTAHAKGVAPIAIVLRHAARNAAVPVLATVGSSLAILIEGAVLAEVVFNIPGIGTLAADAIRDRDYPVIQGLLINFALFHVAVNFLIDLTYTMIDSRILLR
jgi:peptide/nickel transport system permease protein